MAKRGRKGPVANRDPITGAPGAHPLGTGAGAAAGGVAGAEIGAALGGPVGTLLGGIAGAVAGGLAGKGAAELVNPTAEEAYWKLNYVNEPYYSEGEAFDYYAPAYRTGWEGHARYPGKRFEDVEDDLRAEYDHSRSGRSPEWSEAREAARSAWNRIEETRIFGSS